MTSSRNGTDVSKIKFAAFIYLIAIAFFSCLALMSYLDGPEMSSQNDFKTACEQLGGTPLDDLCVNSNALINVPLTPE